MLTILVTQSLQAALLSQAHLKHTCMPQVANPALFFLALVLPLILLLIRFNPLPTSDETKGNCIITFAFLLRLGEARPTACQQPVARQHGVGQDDVWQVPATRVVQETGVGCLTIAITC